MIWSIGVLWSQCFVFTSSKSRKSRCFCGPKLQRNEAPSSFLAWDFQNGCIQNMLSKTFLIVTWQMSQVCVRTTNQVFNRLTRSRLCFICSGFISKNSKIQRLRQTGLSSMCGELTYVNYFGVLVWYFFNGDSSVLSNCIVHFLFVRV